MRRFNVPTNRRPSSPGEILQEEFITPLGYTQEQFASALKIDRVRLNGLLKGRRRLTTDTALRLARVLGTSAEMWLTLQTICDLYEAQNSQGAAEIATLKRIRRVGGHGMIKVARTATKADGSRRVKSR